MATTVSDVAKLANVSVRTLHHYDEIGLLEPSARSAAGYRLYGPADLEKLQQILLFRELGFPLADIRRIMTDPRFDRSAALTRQRKMLEAREGRIQAMLGAVDRALAATEKGIAMDDKDMFEVFGDFDPKAYKDEARERWGETDAYKESARRTKAFTKNDWKRVKAEQDGVVEDFAEAFRSGARPGDPAVQEIVERHRKSIENFYACSRQMHANLGRMYVADPRFEKYYEDRAEGLAQFVCDAIVYAAEHGE